MRVCVRACVFCAFIYRISHAHAHTHMRSHTSTHTHTHTHTHIHFLFPKQGGWRSSLQLFKHDIFMCWLCMPFSVNQCSCVSACLSRAISLRTREDKDLCGGDIFRLFYINDLASHLFSCVFVCVRASVCVCAYNGHSAIETEDASICTCKRQAQPKHTYTYTHTYTRKRRTNS